LPGGRPQGAKDSQPRIKKPEFVRLYNRFKRKYDLDPVAALFEFANGSAEGCTAELRYRACKDLVVTRYAPATVAKFEEAQLQQDLFDAGTDQKIVFGLGNAAA
jgi:hypothetical protein